MGDQKQPTRSPTYPKPDPPPPPPKKACSHKFVDSVHCLKCGWVPPCPYQSAGCTGPVFQTRNGLCCGVHGALVCSRCGSDDPKNRIFITTSTYPVLAAEPCIDPYHTPLCPWCGSDDPAEKYAIDRPDFSYDGCEADYHREATSA